jgi:O-methyltransferase
MATIGRDSMVRRVKALLPLKVGRLYRRFVSPLLKDKYYYEYSQRREFFRKALMVLSFNGIDGDYAEFGCCGAMTFGLAHRFLKQYGHPGKMWAFDSFCGLPAPRVPEDSHPIWVPGSAAMQVEDFRKACREHDISETDYTIVPGFYEDTLREQAQGPRPTNICLAFVDCDLYSSTKEVLDFLMPRLKHGMIIAFDDYYCWSASQASGERKACAEYFRDNPEWILVPFVQFGWGGMSFVFERRALSASSKTAF